MTEPQAYVVQIPFLSQLSVEDEELSYMAQMLYFTSWTGVDGAKLLKGNHTTWKAAHEARFDELTALFEKGGDDKAFQTLSDMSRMETSTSERMKNEFLAAKRQRNLQIITLEWPGYCVMADPELMAQCGMEEGMQSCCWNCAKRNCELLKCSKCQKALYCSRECQSSSWWHHKRTTSAEFGCCIASGDEIQDTSC